MAGKRAPHDPGSEHGTSAEAPVPSAPAFEKVVERLEAIADKLESGETELEEALALFEEGVRLAKTGHERLDAAEKRLEILQQNGSLAPFEPGGEDR